MVEFDPGPPSAFAEHFASVPDYAPFKEHFWFDWGPIFYRGRLDGSARLLCVASDPGPTERIAARTLVGDAGQRVQGFLSKLGLTHSYLCVNAFAYALFPGSFFSTDPILNDPAQLLWRNQLFDMIAGPNLKAIVAFGNQAHTAVSLWPGHTNPGLTVLNLPHPSSHDEGKLLDGWRAAIPQLRGILAPDPDGDATGPNYGPKFTEADYAAIPKRDLPFGVPSFLGDDAWGRTAHPAHNNSVSRPSPDDRHTLVWKAPVS